MPTEIVSPLPTHAITDAPPAPDVPVPGVPAPEASVLSGLREGLAAAESPRAAWDVFIETTERVVRPAAMVHWQADLPDRASPMRWLRGQVSPVFDAALETHLSSVCQHASRSGAMRKRSVLSQSATLAAFPLLAEPHHGGAVGVVLEQEPAVDRAAALRTLAVATEQLGRRLQTFRLDEQRRLAEDCAATLELVTEALRGGDLRDTAQTVVCLLAEHLELHRAALGTATKTAASFRVLALSDASAIERNGEQTAAMEQAMAEAFLLGRPLTIVPQDASTASSPADDASVFTAGASLAQLWRRPLVAVPLDGAGTECRAVLLLAPEEASQRDRCQRVAEACGPALAGVLEAQSRRRAAPGAFWRRAFRTNPARAATAAVAVALAAMFLPLQHRPKFEAEIEPQLRRYVAVPFDAVLRECRVQPGDVVHRGQVLATLEGRELRWRRDALQADYDRAVKRRDAAQATRAFAKLQLARLEIERLRVELELIDHQLSQLQLTSPVDGMILSGDLTRTEGAPLDKGQTLLEVAPVAELIVEVAIPDARINWVRPDARAELRLDATGQRCWSTRISRIHPRSELRDEQNVFIAECALPAEPSPSGAGPLRPGMKGRVRVDCGARPLGWILFHRPLESLRSLWW